MTHEENIVAAARAAINTPFRHQGRIVGRGIDCAGLAIHAFSTAGVDSIDRIGYPRRAGGSMLEDALDSQPGIKRTYGDPVAGDLLLMRFDGDPQHLAICAGATIIHAWAVARKVCEHDFTAEWRSHVVRVYRVKNDGI
jgi:cell wall-associated NlpC family hydrolase